MKNIDQLCMQEKELKYTFQHSLISFPGYTIETDTNSECSRVVILINKSRDMNWNDKTRTLIFSLK